MKMNVVRSSNIASYGYDMGKKELHIKFKHAPQTYVYKGVPTDKAQGMDTAISKGDFFARNIKNRFTFSIKPQ